MRSPRIGDAIPRKEDIRLLKGEGHFSDDESLDGQLFSYVLRSPHPHAQIDAIDTTEAALLPGVQAIFTGADVVSDGLAAIPHTPVLVGSLDIELPHRKGQPLLTEHHILARERAIYLGEAVAFVVANSLAEAKDAAEKIEVSYSPLPFVIAASDAQKSDAPVLHKHFGSNIALDSFAGDKASTDAAFASASHVARLKTHIQRITGVPLEPRCAVGAFDSSTNRYILRAGSGNVVRQKRELATILRVREEDVRVIAADVGGNFGTRNAFYPEFALVCWAARRLGQPVKWTAERGEAFLSDYQARDLEVEAELALDSKGNFLAIRSTNLSNAGAYSVNFGPLTKGVELMSGVYRINAAYVEARAIYTNTPPTNSYRSSGRPEAMFVLERLIEKAAREFGFDRVDLRRKNILKPTELPFRNPLGLTYDSGCYGELMEDALLRGEWSTFEKRRKEAKRSGKLRGIAIGNYIEISSGLPRERARVEILPCGIIEVVIGTLSSGQGHETSFAQLVTEMFGVQIDQVRIVTGDTDRVTAGGGSHAGRSMRLAGVTIGTASKDIIRRASEIAAHYWRVSPSSVEIRDGKLVSHESNLSLDIFELAGRAAVGEGLPSELVGPLSSVCDEVAKAAAFPFGTAACEVEIDAETGDLQIIRYIAIDDVGRAVNPLILHGQAHGSIAQGVGQALFERCIYDEQSGQLLSGSFMDYAMPRAQSLPSYETVISELPAATNPLGIRSGGEGATTPALAVVVNAILDALRDFDIDHLEMPVTSQKIWAAIQKADRRRKIDAELMF